MIRTLAEAKEALKEIGMVIKTTSESSRYNPEYRVNFIGGKESTAYYTNHLGDAVETGRDMHRQRQRNAR